MEQNPYWETNRFSASQEIPRHFMEPEGSLPTLKEAATCPYPEPHWSRPCTPSLFLEIHFNIILSSTRKWLPRLVFCLFLQTFYKTTDIKTSLQMSHGHFRLYPTNHPKIWRQYPHLPPRSLNILCVFWRMYLHLVQFIIQTNKCTICINNILFLTIFYIS